MGRLTAAGVTAALKKPGKHSDGGGLHLLVRGPGAASWIARLQHGGRRREYGLGSAELVSLSEARDRCRAFKKELREGRDPLALNRPPPGLIRPFSDAAHDFLLAKFTDENRRRAKRRLEMHALPRLGRLQVQTIDADLIAETLAPIWTKQPETGRMVRSLIIRVLRFARPDGFLLESTLAKAVADRLPRQPGRGNRAAMPYEDVPAAMAKLAAKGGLSALALRFAILTCGRGQEVRGALWSEIDWENRVWNVAAARMKMRRPHKVPLSEEALTVLAEAAQLRRAGCELIFPSRRDGMLTDMAMGKAMKDLGLEGTQHGCRASFGQWVDECTTAAEPIREACLAHAITDKVMAAYRRGDFFEQRRQLMAVWGSYCGGSTGAAVVQLETRRA
jgi:integrase